MDPADHLGQIVESYWSRDYDGIEDAVGRTAAAEAWYEAGKKLGFAPVAVVAI